MREMGTEAREHLLIKQPYSLVRLAADHSLVLICLPLLRHRAPLATSVF